MATALATLRLDRNPAAFQVPATLGRDSDFRQLIGILNSTFVRVNRAFQTLKVIVEGPDGTGGMTALHTGSNSALIGNITLTPGTGISIVEDEAGKIFTWSIDTAYVTTLRSGTNPAIFGDLTLIPGTGITITEDAGAGTFTWNVGATGGGGGGVVPIFSPFMDLPDPSSTTDLTASGFGTYKYAGDNSTYAGSTKTYSLPDASGNEGKFISVIETDDKSGTNLIFNVIGGANIGGESSYATGGPGQLTIFANNGAQWYVMMRGQLRPDRTLADVYSDSSTAGTAGADETLYTFTIPADTFHKNGDKAELDCGGTFVSSGTATRKIKVAFAGSTIFDTGALTISLAASWVVYGVLIRVSATVIRYSISLTTEGAALAAYTAVGELTGLTLSADNTLVVTGAAGGVGAGAADIVAKMGAVRFSAAG